jgi:hypothetical protein
MSRSSRRWIGLWALVLAAAARAQQPVQTPVQTPVQMGAMDSTDGSPAMAAGEAMGARMAEDAHMRLTAQRRGSAADTARAQALVAEMRRALAKYQDVHVAEADGFRRFLPGVKQPIYHFTKWQWGLEAMFGFHPDKPTSLLYREAPDGDLVLVGAMYTAPARATEDELDARIPLSVARWHEHVNWCLPPRGATQRWREVQGGHPVFGPRSPIATKAACDAVGGRFRGRVFGWMVHVQAFASDDPEVIWSVHHHGEHGGP